MLYGIGYGRCSRIFVPEKLLVDDVGQWIGKGNQIVPLYLNHRSLLLKVRACSENKIQNFKSTE